MQRLHFALLALLLGWAFGQSSYVVDLTQATVKQRAHEPETATAGIAAIIGTSSGILPRHENIELKLIAITNVNGVNVTEPIIAVSLSNRGTEAITIPVDASPADIEPVPFTTPYSFKSAFIRLMRDGAESELGTLALYGSPAAPGTVKSLEPGQSIEIRGRVSGGSTQPGSWMVETDTRLKGLLWIDDNTVTQQGRTLHQSIQESLPPVRSANEITISPKSVN